MELGVFQVLEKWLFLRFGGDGCETLRVVLFG